MKKGANCTHELITDAKFENHQSLCSLIESGRDLAFYGSFNKNDCELHGPVCGINGVTYSHECEAFSGEFVYRNSII